MRTKRLTRSFAGGEIGPELYGRLDLVKHQTGLAKCLNCIVLPHGPVQNRPGWEYVLEVKDSTKAVRVVPFAYSTEQTFAIEFGDQYIRWHTNGATLLETAQSITSISKANPGVVGKVAHGYNNGDWLYLTATGMVELNGRFVKVANKTADTFELTDIHGGANINTTAFGAFVSGTMARVYEISSPYLEADLFDLHFEQSADVITIVHPNYAVRELRRLGAASWSLTTVTFAPTITTPGAPTLTTGGPGGGSPISHYYKCTALAEGTLEESLASASANASLDLTVSGNYIDVDPPSVTGAVRYNIYKLSNGLYGYIGQTEGSAFRDNNVTPDISQTPPEASTPFTGAGNYPGAVGYHEQRRCFGGTNNSPQNFWATRSATESNLSYSIPTRDDDAISFRIAAREVNRIYHIVSLDKLLLLTSGGEWEVAPQNSDILTPASAAPKRIGAEGASRVSPVVAGSSVIYVQESGSRMRELRYKWEANGYQINDISILAPHLFDDYTIEDMAYGKAPHKIVWCVRSDGTLLGMTYLPEHEVFAWHQHTTDGSFESICSVKEGAEHVQYAVIQRTINGRSVRYVERSHTRRFAVLEDAFFVDAGLTYDGSATTTIRGAWHLEGEKVAVLADGAVVTGVTVSDGVITLPQAASVVHFGLGYTADIQTLPLAVEVDGALGQGTTKNVNDVYLRVADSSGVFVGPDFDNLTEYKQRTDEPYDSPPALLNGMLDPITIEPGWGQDAQVCIRQPAPLPLTVLSMVLEVALGG